MAMTKALPAARMRLSGNLQGGVGVVLTLAVGVAVGGLLAISVTLVVAAVGVVVTGVILTARPNLALLGCVWWITFVTVDPVSLGPVPLKLPILLVALSVWFAHRRHSGLPFTVLVLAVATGVPVVWSVVASAYPHPYAGLTPSPTSMTLEHASHFIYLLIYFPLADYALTKARTHVYDVWLVPVLALCVLTWCLYVAYGYLHLDIGASLSATGLGASSRVGPLAGIVTGAGSGTVRLFFANHILLLPAAAAAVGYALIERRSRRRLLPLAFVLATLYPTQTRALIFGALVVLAVAAIITARLGSPWPSIAFGVALVLLLVGPTSNNRATAFITNPRDDASIQSRVEQAPELLAAWRTRPILGSGLGATLPTGYIRSQQQPYAFEDTYDAILFQNGLIGLIVIMALPFIACVRALQVIPRLPREERAFAVVGVAGLAGIFAASAVTPYLVSSYGMLAVAAMLASIARAVERGRRAGSAEDVDPELPVDSSPSG